MLTQDLILFGAYNTSELAGYEDYDPRNPYGITSVDASTISESQGVVFWYDGCRYDLQKFR